MCADLKRKAASVPTKGSKEPLFHAANHGVLWQMLEAHRSPADNHLQPLCRVLSHVMLAHH